MDLVIFKRQLKKAYSESYCSYSFDDCLQIFEYYFNVYEYMTGHSHPPIKTVKLIELLSDMSCDGLIEPFNYKEMIDNYFYTHYPNCDRNICHFFSGKIRELKFYETSYFKYGDDEEFF